MTNRIPPLRDLPPGRHDDRRSHLLGELAGPERRSFFPAFSRPTMRAAAFAAAGAAALIIAVAVGSRTIGGSPGQAPVAGGPTLPPGVTLPPGSGSAYCTAPIVYDGHEYHGKETYVLPATPGKVLHGAVQTSCNEMGPDQPSTSTPVEARAIDGVDPSVAILVRGEDTIESVIVRTDVAEGRLPAAVIRLTTPVRCDPADEPISITGRVENFNDADDDTGMHPTPPYDLDVWDTTGTPGYEHARLKVHVPAALETSFTQADLFSVFKTGTVSIVATCRDGRLVATGAVAHPAS